MGHVARAALLCSLISGISAPIQLLWPFVTDGWFEEGGSPAHRGDDMFAQDWRHTERSLGATVLAPLNGLVVSADWTCSGYGKQVVIFDAVRRLASSEGRAPGSDSGAPARIRRSGSLGAGYRGAIRLRPRMWRRSFGPPSPHVHVAVYGGLVHADADARPFGRVLLGDPTSPFARKFTWSPRARAERVPVTILGNPYPPRRGSLTGAESGPTIVTPS